MYKEYSNKSGIYKITNLVNNKIYIGQAVNLFQRWCSHKGCYDDCYIHRAIKKYGWTNFKFEVLEICEKDKLIEKEQFYLDFYKSYNRNIGYNIRKFADTKFGYNHSQETKDKISKAKKCRKASLEERMKRSEFSKLRPVSEKFLKMAVISKYKPVLQIDLEENFIKEWSSVKEISMKLSINYGKLSSHCRNSSKKPINGFRWRYKQLDKGEISVEEEN